MTMDESLVEKAAQDLAESKCAVALTGAGISVESGIPPFRGKGGVWEKIDPTWDPFTKTELEKIRVSIEELREERVSASLPDPRSEVRAPAFDARLESESSPLHTKITVFVEMVESGEVDAGRNRLSDLRGILGKV